MRLKVSELLASPAGGLEYLPCGVAVLSLELVVDGDSVLNPEQSVRVDINLLSVGADGPRDLLCLYGERERLLEPEGERRRLRGGDLDLRL